jgi:hypothetical protein
VVFFGLNNPQPKLKFLPGSTNSKYSAHIDFVAIADSAACKAARFCAS